MDPIVGHLLENRDLDVPDAHRTALEEHWKKMRRLRSQVDEASLADHEIAVTWSAAGGRDER
jgi:hypothetical protein